MMTSSRDFKYICDVDTTGFPEYDKCCFKSLTEIRNGTEGLLVYLLMKNMCFINEETHVRRRLGEVYHFTNPPANTQSAGAKMIHQNSGVLHLSL